MKGNMGEVLDAPNANDSRPVIGLVIGSVAALTLWGGILGLIALIV